MEVIADGNYLRGLYWLIYFLDGWKERPISLTPMAYQWCSAISEVDGRLRSDGISIEDADTCVYVCPDDFPQFGSNSGPSRLDDTSRRLREPESEDLDFLGYLHVAFGQVGSAFDELAKVRLNHTSHHDRVFEAAFSSDDELIADAACAWLTKSPGPGLFMHYFAERAENPKPFPPRLRQVVIRVIGDNRFPDPGLEFVRLLDRLDAGVDDLHRGGRWHRLLVDVIRSPTGENLSSHYWRLLGEMELDKRYIRDFEMRDVEVMRSLEKAEDWEKLEVWTVIVWMSLPASFSQVPESVEDVTLELLLSRPSALQRFENLPDLRLPDTKARLGEVLNRARVGRLSSEAQHPITQYGSVHPSLFPSVLTPTFFPSSQLVPLLFAGDDTF